MTKRSYVTCRKAKSLSYLPLNCEVELVAVRPAKAEVNRQEAGWCDEAVVTHGVHVRKWRNTARQICVRIRKGGDVAELLPDRKRLGIFDGSPSIAGNTAEEK